MSKFVMTGGLGVIGRHLESILRQRGHQVRTCDHSLRHGPQHLRRGVGSYRLSERAARTGKVCEIEAPAGIAAD